MENLFKEKVAEEEAIQHEEHPTIDSKTIHQIAIDHLKKHPMAEKPEFQEVIEKVSSMDENEEEGEEVEESEEATEMPTEAKFKVGKKNRVERMVKEFNEKE